MPPSLNQVIINYKTWVFIWIKKIFYTIKNKFVNKLIFLFLIIILSKKIERENVSIRGIRERKISLPGLNMIITYYYK